jgi:hypothetical protein
MEHPTLRRQHADPISVAPALVCGARGFSALFAWQQLGAPPLVTKIVQCI